MKAWLVVLVLLVSAPAFAKGKAELLGTWYNNEQGFKAELKADGSALVNGEVGAWSVEGGNLVYVGNSGAMVYSYTLKGKTLTLHSSDGATLVYTRSPKAVAKAKTAKGSAKSSAGDNNAFLRGMLCSYSGGSTMSHSDRVSFDGRGHFSTGSESVYSASGTDQYGNESWRGGGGSNSAGDGGTYQVRGEVVILTAADGSSAEAKINMRQSDGRITELMVGKKLFAAGLCE